MNPLDRLTKSKANAAPETEEIDDHQSFGVVRGIRERAVMLELRQKDGSILALHYSWLERAEFDPSTGITLTFGGHTVKLTGRNLNGHGDTEPQVRLFASLVRHRVAWVCESGGDDVFRVSPGMTFIDRISH